MMFDLPPHLFFPLAVLSAYLLYGAVLYSFGGTHGKERALDVWHRGGVGFLLFAAATVITIALGAAVTFFISQASAAFKTPQVAGEFKPVCLSHFTDRDYLRAVEKAYQCAVGVYRRYFDAIASGYGSIFTATALTGVLVITGGYSMGLSQAAMPYSSAATSALLALAAAVAATYVTYGFVLLMGLGAVLVAEEKTRHLGALILGVAAGFPPALAGGADVLQTIKVPEVDWSKYILFSSLIGVAADAAAVAAVTVTALSVAAAAAYAISRIFDHAGAHLAIE
ncbi:hypothetical protein [Pyrobaculum ferrireducens]|nr:hypothetical protein [Pyrobaculum ferrireducens]